MTNLRIGNGYDVHAFEAGDHVVLGGVKIPFSSGLKAHSDGDVAIHALCDALLGAAALGDIGRHFPDNDVQYSAIDSRVLLRRVAGLLQESGFSCVNIDLTIIAEAPKMAPHIEAMRKNLADDLGLSLDTVSVKATTTEKLGFTGRGEGIAASAVALLEKNSSSGH
ncbi:MAG: 2-C-methyl-D-erythritol 2,4-cyclodiphosphate synthase [Gammaproteobacteria bacterium]|nr:2-C-methyl-D-erythritol 2,4-cyclodiphosphate synthase [Gammaproteobacteria bacterium]